MCDPPHQGKDHSKILQREESQISIEAEAIM